VSSEPPEKTPKPEPGAEKGAARPLTASQRRARLVAWLNPRERVGDFFNAFEENRSLRRKCLGALLLIGVFAGTGWWLMPRWRERSSIRVARQWLGAGKLDRAGEAVRDALARAPQRVEAWQVAAEYARALGQKQKAAAYLRQAAALRPADIELELDWAAAGIVAGNLVEAEGVIKGIPADARARSARAERLAGEIARQRGDVTAARLHFESAVRLEGAAADNQIPLAVVLLGSGMESDRRAGRAMLEKWKADPAWGPEALRALLADAMARDDRGAMPGLAAELIAHPRRERADTFNSLLAFAKSDPERFASALAEVERLASAEAAQVAELVGWLSGTGHGAEAVRWVGSLPKELTAVPPVSVALAEALRVARDWPALKRAVAPGDWGDVEFLRQTYLAFAERALGNTADAEKLWAGVRENSRLNGGRALFLAGTVYIWGWQSEAVELWWIAAEQPGVATSALGALARHYQLQRDAEGLFRAFRKLNEIKSADAGIANNYAYLAALTGRNPAAAERITAENLAAAPNDAAFLATRAFVLHRAGKNAAALALLPKFAEAAKASPSLAFTSGILLAASGRGAEAMPLLRSVDERALTLAELELLRQARSGAGGP
jgi:tetratricopeptide (TPR) repeat protein